MTCLVAAARLAEAPPWLRGVLAPEERARSDALLLPEAAAGTALGRGLVRLLAGAALAADPAEVQVGLICPRCGGPHGPPHVPALAWTWSVAHGGELVLVAASTDGSPIGVDVEPSGTVVPSDVAIGQADPLQHWVQVEAALKLTGDGLTVDPASVRLDRGHVTGYPGPVPPGILVRPLDVGTDHVAALATLGESALLLVDVTPALAASDARGAARRLAADLRIG